MKPTIPHKETIMKQNIAKVVVLLAVVFLTGTSVQAGGVVDWSADKSLENYKEPSVSKAARYSLARHTRVLSAQVIHNQGQRTADTLDGRSFRRRNPGSSNTNVATGHSQMDLASRASSPVDALALMASASTTDSGSPSNGVILWGSFYGGTSDYQRHGDRQGFEACTYGTILGMEYDLTDDCYIGFMVAYERNRMKFGSGTTNSITTQPWLLNPFIINETISEVGGNASVETLRFGPYVSKRFGLWFVNASVTAGLHDVKYQRKILSAGTQVGSITGNLYNTWSDSATIKGHYQAWDLALSGTVGRDIPLADNQVLSPYLSMMYNYIHQNGFTETGDVSIARSFHATRETALTSYLGTRYQYSGQICKTPVTVNLNAAWAHQWLGGDEKQVGRGVVTNNAYGAKQSLSRTTNDYFVYGAGVELPLSDSTSLSVGYQGQFGSDHVTHFGSVQLRVAL